MKNPFVKNKRGGASNNIVRYNYTNKKQPTVDSASIHDKLDQLYGALDKSNIDYNPRELEDKSRKNIAFWFVRSFIVIIGVLLLFIPVYNALVFDDVRVIVQEASYSPIDIEKVIATVGAVLGTPLGFVVGYYFKEKSEKD